MRAVAPNRTAGRPGHPAAVTWITFAFRPRLPRRSVSRSAGRTPPFRRMLRAQGSRARSRRSDLANLLTTLAPRRPEDRGEEGVRGVQQGQRHEHRRREKTGEAGKPGVPRSIAQQYPEHEQGEYGSPEQQDEASDAIPPPPCPDVTLPRNEISGHHVCPQQRETDDQPRVQHPLQHPDLLEDLCPGAARRYRVARGQHQNRPQESQGERHPARRARPAFRRLSTDSTPPSRLSCPLSPCLRNKGGSRAKLIRPAPIRGRTKAQVSRKNKIATRKADAYTAA